MNQERRIPNWQELNNQQSIIHFDNKALEEAIQATFPQQDPRIKWTALVEEWAKEPAIGDLEPFVWRAEPFKLTPTAPVNPLTEDTNSLSELCYSGKAGQVPAIEWSAKTDPPRKDLLYNFSLFAYESIQKGKSWEVGPVQKFVYVTSGVKNVESPRRFFMRLQDLRDRLCGNFETRQKLFAKDWFVAFVGIAAPAYRTQFLQQLDLQLQSPLLPDLSELYDKKDDLTQASEKVHKALYKFIESSKTLKLTSHFPIWNENGLLLDWDESTKLLASLFNPITYSKNLARGYIYYLCGLVRAAAVLEKEVWSVEARGWSRPVESSDKIQFTYHLSHSWSRNKEGASVLDKKALELWAKIITTQHEIVADEFKKQVQHQTFTPNREAILEFDDPPRADDFVWIGSHPQRFYDLYVKRSDWKLMHDQGYQLGSRSAPNESDIDQWKQEIEDADPDVAVTYTEISKDKLDRMTEDAYPRCISQKALMGKSAKVVGQSFAGIDNIRQAEWLHRSAWSFGGLDYPDNHGPSSSQHKNNLVWGTYEANTRMIRYEDYLKRYVRFRPQTTLRLWTTRIYEDWVYEDPNENPGSKTTRYEWPQVDQSTWLASGLLYQWAITPSTVIQGSAMFHLFSRSGCMRFEMRMDRYVDEHFLKLVNSGSPAAGQILHYLWGPLQGNRGFDQF